MTNQKTFETKQDVYDLFNEITPNNNVQIYDIHNVLRKTKIQLQELRDYASQNNLKATLYEDEYCNILHVRQMQRGENYTPKQIEAMQARVALVCESLPAMLSDLVDQETNQEFEACAKIKRNLDSLVNGVIEDTKDYFDYIGFDVKKRLEDIRAEVETMTRA